MRSAPWLPRLIPARAGNTSARVQPVLPDPAHPRSRGEHRTCVQSEQYVTGSSPLARGTRTLPVAVHQPFRLIPARAGNTAVKVSRWKKTAAHPRSRGEHSAREDVLHTVHGSSPLARGTHRQGTVLSFAMRLIPARAGNTSPRGARPSALPAHPRSRGEHMQTFRYRFQVCGSSPLARGTRGFRSTWGCCFRLIPARAGNTVTSVVARMVRQAHPRSRGEH